MAELRRADDYFVRCADAVCLRVGGRLLVVAGPWYDVLFVRFRMAGYAPRVVVEMAPAEGVEFEMVPVSLGAVSSVALATFAEVESGRGLPAFLTPVALVT